MLSKKKILISMVILIIMFVLVFILPNLDQLNGKYIAKAQLGEGFFAFGSYRGKLLENYKKEGQCPSAWKKDEKYKYVQYLEVLSNKQYNKCYFIVTMREDKLVEKRIRGVSLIFPIGLNMNNRNCYTNINKENSYLVINDNYSYCRLGIPEDIEKIDNNHFKFKVKETYVDIKKNKIK